MYKKKLRRLGVACMTVAMVLTTVSFPSVAKAEEGTSTQADGVTSSELEKGKVLVQVDQNVLKANAISNSNQSPVQWTNDGAAGWAFDNENHWWHSRYNFNDATYFVGETLKDENAIINENPWIGSGFGREITLYKITYTRRDWSGQTASNGIKKFKLYVSQDGTNWSQVETKNQELQDNSNEQDIVLTTPTKAKYFKLEALSNWQVDSFVRNSSVSVKSLKAYELKDIPLTIVAPAKDNTSEIASSTDTTADQVIGDASGNCTVTGGTVVGENEFDIANQMTITPAKNADFSGAASRYVVQAKVNLRDLKIGSAVTIASKGDEFGLLIRRNGTTSNVNISMGCTGLNGTSDTWLEASINNVDYSAYLKKDVLVTGVRDGNTMKVWFGDSLVAKATKSNFPTKSSGNAIAVGSTATATADLSGSISDVKIVNCSESTDDIHTSRPDPDALVKANKGVYTLNLQGTPASTQSCTSTTTTTETSAVDTETGTTKKTYTTTTTISPVNGSVIVTAPEAVTVNIDGNTANNKVVPVSEESTLTTDGTATVKYVFEDMLRGGSLRMIKENGETDNTKTSMRFGYDFKLPTGTTFDSCEWYYGTTASDLQRSLAPGAATKKIENPTATKQGYIRSNIVFTNIAKTNFAKDIYARVLVNYTKDGKTYSKMGAYVDQNSVNSIAEKIRMDGSETEKAYVEKLTTSN